VIVIQRLVEWSLQNRFLVLAFTAVLAVAGVHAATRLPIDAVPDISNVQVQVLTTAPALGPLEVERFVTTPIERAMTGIPEVVDVRSVSKFGLSQVTIVFADDADIYRARQLVSERLQEARAAIPAGYGEPVLAPITTGLGEIYQFEVRGPGRSAMELRALLEGPIATQLRTVPGVIEVNTFGGELKTYQLELDPARLVAHRLTLREVLEAVEHANGSAGGAYLERHREQVLVRGDGLIRSLDDLGDTVVALGAGGTPVYLRQLGRVAFVPAVRQGVVTRDGRGEIVAGVTLLLLGENARAVVDRVRARVAAIQPTLPPGVRIEPYYDRTDLIRRTVATVARNLVEGGLLVVFVLFLMLRNLRAGLVVAAMIPLAMLGAFVGMRAAGLSGNLMSLGAIDFGLVVDGAIIIVENAVRHLSERHARQGRALTPAERDEVVLASSLEVRSATAFGELIIALVYLPILTLEGVEGKMFRPMALTVIFALATAFVLSLTLTPVLASLLLPLRLEERESWLVAAARRAYRPLLDAALRRRWVTVGVALAALALAAGVAATRGGEFIPELDEGAMALEVYRLPSTSLPEAARQTTDLERALRSFPEVETVVCRTGRGEIAMDPMGVEMTDVLVTLRPRERWRFRRREDLVEAMERRVRSAVPGIVFGFSQPIKQRMAELIAGARGDVVVKLFGDDLDLLRGSADEIARSLRRVPGAQDVRAEQVSGLPMRRVAIDRRAAARYGVRVGDVLDTVSALGGITVGEVREGALAYAIQVRFDPATRAAPDALSDLPVATLDGRTVPLAQVATITDDPGPAQVSHEDVSRRVAIQANVRGRDLASFVAEARARVGREVRLPPGYRVEWGGQFEQLEAATRRLGVVIPLALGLIFVLLYTSFNAARPAAIIFLNVPFAATGGVLALAARGMPFSISAAVGFIALFGVAVLNGLVLVSTARHREEAGDDPARAVREAALVRMRPVLTTALVASLGFVPMALSDGAGAEVQRPLATVVIGGIVSSTLLTLLVLPALYAWLGGRRATDLQPTPPQDQAP